jgi:S-adenosylhomocysteine hydrolase
MIDKTLRQKMPLLNNVVLQHESRKPLANLAVLLIQHQLQDSYAQVSALLELGLDPKELYWIDIPYTSNGIVRSAVQGLGVPSKNFWSHAYRPTIPYRTYQLNRVREWIRSVARRIERDRKLIVMEDGAYFLEAAADSECHLRKIAIVEQSQSGINWVRAHVTIRDYAEKTPVINVAESSPKKILEAPMIADAIGDALWESVAGRLHIFSGRDCCLITGYGSVGACVASRIPQRFGFSKSCIYVYDPIADRQRLATAQGYQRWYSDKPTVRFKLVIGCSGERSFTVHDCDHLEDGAFLVSASTGSVELSIEDFLRAARIADSSKIHINNLSSLEKARIHSEIQFRFDNRSATVLNGGFPINFDGKRIDRIPPEEIQLTAALMVQAAVQAATTTDSGIVPLDDCFCQQIASDFKGKSGN